MDIDNLEINPTSEIRTEETRDTIYEEYRNRYDEYGAISIDQLNVDVGESNVPNWKTKKFWLLAILTIAFSGLVVGLAVGLSVYFKEPPLPITTTASTNLSIITSPASKTLSTTTLSITTTTTSTTTTKTSQATIKTMVTNPTTFSNENPEVELATTESRMKEAVIMLSTRVSSNVPIIIGLNGGENFKLSIFLSIKIR